MNELQKFQDKIRATLEQDNVIMSIFNAMCLQFVGSSGELPFWGGSYSVFIDETIDNEVVSEFESNEEEDENYKCDFNELEESVLQDCVLKIVRKIYRLEDLI
jgi:hypothetical protein